MKYWSKSILFGILGALGCLLAALVGEGLLAWLLPPAEAMSPPPQPVDIVFVLDDSGSMSGEIEGVKQGIADFVSEFRQKDLDVRVGLVAFRDRALGEEPRVLDFAGETFTSDPAVFADQTGTLEAGGGSGESNESSLDALVLASQGAFRPDAIRALILIGDEPPKVPDVATPSVEAAALALMSNHIDFVHLAVDPRFLESYAPLQASIPGHVFPLAETAAARRGFAEAMPRIGHAVAEAIRTGSPVQSEVATSTDRFGALMLATGTWIAVLAVGVCLALMMGQNRFCRRALLTPGQAASGVGGGLAAGMLAGAAGQLLYGGATYGGATFFPAMVSVGRVVSWGLLGALLGWGTSFFIPNLKARAAMLGGGAGGVLGALAFLWMANGVSDQGARLLGAAVLGFCIGLMVVLAEAAAREMWLEITYAPNEVTAVSLGPVPVVISSDPVRSTVCVSEAPTSGFSYVVDGGRVVFKDLATGRTLELRPGAVRRYGDVTVEVKAAAGFASSSP